MVYESDFYTNRRPYRPSSYSASTFQTIPMRYIPILSKGKLHSVSAYYPTYGGSQRLMMSRAAPHRVVAIRVRPSVVIRELDHIQHKLRPAVAYSATEDFMCSSSNKKWEDESRKIRAQTASLLQRCQASVPRASSVVPITTIARYEPKYMEPLLPAKYKSDNYVKSMVMPVRNVARDIISMSWYAEPTRKFTGRGHLSCLSYSGAKAYPKRKALCQDFTVKDDVTLLSFYVKNRLASLGMALESATAAPDKKEQPALVECSS